MARYQIEELVGVGPDDAEWQGCGPDYDHGTLDLAILEAKRFIKPTEHGASAVRVWDSYTESVVWEN